MRNLPYLTKNRHHVYYFRLIFTQSVRSLSKAPQEICLSLQTKDVEIAQDRYMILYPCARAFRWSLHELVIKGVIDVSILKLKVQNWKEKNQLRELMAQKDDELFETRRALLHANHDKNELADHALRMRDSNQRLTGALGVMMESKDPITVPSAFSESIIIEDAVNSEVSLYTSESTAELETTETTATSPKPKKPSRKRVRKSQTLLAYVELFITHEGQTSTNDNPGEARRNYLMRFLDIIGYNVTLTSLNADHVRHYREMMHRIPANFDKQGFKIPRARALRPKWFKETIQNWEGKTLGGGINSHFKHVRMFLIWANNEHHLKYNFAAMLKMSPKRKAETKTKTVNFLAPDLHKLFIDGYLYGDSSPLKESDKAWKFWVPLIAMYTGMRSEEIGILSLKHFIQQEGFWCIQIPNKAKSKAGIRTFPIPQRLLDVGLLDYRQQIVDETSGDNEARIFPDLPRKGLTYSNRIGQFFNRNCNARLKDGTPEYSGYLHRCGITNPSEKESFKFHSFRHSFITLIHETKLPDTELRLSLDLLKNLVGHKGDFKKYGIAAETWNDVTKMTYNHHDRVPLMVIRERFTLMKQAMDAMDFGVDLSGISYARFLARK